MYMHDQTYVKLVHVEFWGHMLTPLITGVAQSLIQLETHVRSLAQAVNQSSQKSWQTGRLRRALGNSICQWATWGEHLQNWNMSPVFQCVNSDTIIQHSTPPLTRSGYELYTAAHTCTLASGSTSVQVRNSKSLKILNYTAHAHALCMQHACAGLFVCGTCII